MRFLQNNNNKKSLYILLVILVVGLFIRTATSLRRINTVLQGDEIVYRNLAEGLVRGKGLGESLHHPPLYPFFLSVVYRITDGDLPLMRMWQSVVSALLPLLVFFLAFEITHGDKVVSFVSCGITAIDPFLIYFSSSLTSEILFTIFLLFALIFMQKAFISSSKKVVIYSLIAGFGSALALLTRAVVLGFIYLLPLLLFFLRPIKRYLLRFAFFIAIFIIMLLPWMYRNYKVSGNFILITSQAGWNMWEAMNPKPYSPQACSEWILSMNRESEGMSEIEKDKYFLQKTLNYFKTNPIDFISMGFKKFFRFWRLYPYDPYPLKYKVISILFFTPLLIFSIYGVWCSWKKFADRVLILYLLIFYTCLSAFVFCPAIRYRLHIHPIMAIFAAIALEQIYKKSRILFKYD